MSAVRLPATETEAGFQAAVIELAHVLGFRVAHFRAARTKRGWSTPVAADGKGWPDLCLVGHGRCVFLELKAERGRLRPEQVGWLEHLEANGVEAHLFRPSDWEAVVAVLRGG